MRGLGPFSRFTFLIGEGPHNSRRTMQPTSLVRLGLLHGATVGLALTMGLWMPEVVALFGVPVEHLYPTLALGSGALVLIGALAGAFSARFPSVLFGGLVWFGAGLLLAWVVGGLLSDVQSLAVWLADPRFWGEAVYPATAAGRLRGGMAGFFIVLLLTVYGLLQRNRLESLRAEFVPGLWLTGRGWFVWLAGLLPLLVVGLIAHAIVLQPVYGTVLVVERAIQVVRATDGELFDLSQRDGINYNALKGVRQELTGAYRLQIGQVDWGPVNTTHLIVEFENGAWLVCRLMGESLSHCADASPPYVAGFASLLATGALPADCPACRFRLADEWLVWLAEKRQHFSSAPRVVKERQMGALVMMRAHGDAATADVACIFKGMGPIVLESCQIVDE